MKLLNFKKLEFNLLIDFINNNNITEAKSGPENKSKFDYLDFYVGEHFLARAFLSKNVKNSPIFYSLYSQSDMRILEKFQVCKSIDDVLYITLLGVSLETIKRSI
jgi:hypothetical protein